MGCYNINNALLYAIAHIAYIFKLISQLSAQNLSASLALIYFSISIRERDWEIN